MKESVSAKETRTHIMGENGEILASFFKDKKGNLVFEFDYESPVEIATEIIHGQYGVYSRLTAKF